MNPAILAINPSKEIHLGGRS